MPYVGDKLTQLCHPEPTLRAAERMAHLGGKRLTELTKLKTPVDTGALRESFKQKLVMARPGARGTVFESGVETDVDHAPDVEYGTGLWGPKHAKYLIEPKIPGGTLHWIGHGGEDVFAARVWHPGSPGAHMVALAVGELEATLPAVMEAELHRWAREQEEAARL